MPYIHYQLDQRLQRERADRIEREFAAQDDGSFDRAIDELVEREKMDNSVLMTAGCGEKSERSFKGIRI